MFVLVGGSRKVGLQELQKVLNAVMKWEYDWQMHFNTHKCFVMRLTHTRHITRFNYKLEDKLPQQTLTPMSDAQTDDSQYLSLPIGNIQLFSRHTDIEIAKHSKPSISSKTGTHVFNLPIDNKYWNLLPDKTMVNTKYK